METRILYFLILSLYLSIVVGLYDKVFVAEDGPVEERFHPSSLWITYLRIIIKIHSHRTIFTNFRHVNKKEFPKNNIITTPNRSGQFTHNPPVIPSLQLQQKKNKGSSQLSCSFHIVQSMFYSWWQSVSDFSLSLSRPTCLSYIFSPIQLKRGNDKAALVGAWHSSRLNRNTVH